MNPCACFLIDYGYTYTWSDGSCDLVYAYIFLLCYASVFSGFILEKKRGLFYQQHAGVRDNRIILSMLSVCMDDSSKLLLYLLQGVADVLY